MEPSPSASDPRGRRLGLRWPLLALVVVGLFVAVRTLPLADGIERFAAWVSARGVLGAIAFGCLYVLAALLFVPGAAITLSAGAIFGVAAGTVLVSAASTTAAALAFLLARHVARDAVVRRAARSPRFSAFDRAVTEGGWRVVALLRLSPAFPFSVGNYLYGLTGVRLLPYAFTSWWAMLPGTVLYVYLGHAGRAGLSAAAGETRRTPAEWIFLATGLVATVVVTGYVGRLARRALREQTSPELDAVGR